MVPGRSVLIWPGLTMAHMLRDAIPAWSMHDRNITQVFGKWVFDTNIQCRTSTTVDTAVCADVSILTGASGSAESVIQSVIPWLGGDYNPW